MKQILFFIAVILSSSCVVSPDPEHTAESASPVVPGPCATACAFVQSGRCNWKAQCSDGRWPSIAVCGPRALTCDAAQTAAEDGGAYGLEYCYRDCEGL